MVLKESLRNSPKNKNVSLKNEKPRNLRGFFMEFPNVIFVCHG